MSSPSRLNCLSPTNHRHSTHIKRNRQARKYGFACANCRRRKAKCDGNLPSCDRCLESRDICHYNKAPSITHAVAMQDRLEALETILQRLKNATDAERSQMLEEHFKGESAKHDSTDTSSRHALKATRSSVRMNHTVDDEVAELLDETTVTKDGRIDFFGRTSHYYVQRERVVRDLGRLTVDREMDAVSYSLFIHETSTSTCAPLVRAPKDLRSALSPEISETLVNELLDVYWCWPHHFHHVVCRNLFMRDLATSGPHVTKFLLNCTLAQAARFSDRPDASDLSALFAKKALECLPEEMDKGSSISTLQGLLILSARECAYGRTSQGWIYSGMAFRMMRDLGLHIHPRLLHQRLGNPLPADVLALRQQIFWSCYTWDKTISMCLGRPPMIHEKMEIPSPEAWVDGEEMDNEPWCPLFPTPISHNMGLVQKSHTATRFSAYCHLSVLINEVLGTLYSHSQMNQEPLSGYFEQAMKKLTDWAQTLPSHIFLQEFSKVKFCPPLHILLLNMVYQALIALLCRPFRSQNPKAKAAATKAAERIDHLATLHVRRFRFRALTYLETYTVFVAATINILDLKEGIEEEIETAKARLAFNVEILRNATSTMSTIQSVEVIEQSLRADDLNKQTVSSNCGYRSHQSTPSSSCEQQRAFDAQLSGRDQTDLLVSQDQQFVTFSGQLGLGDFNFFHNANAEEYDVETLLGTGNPLGDIHNILAEVNSNNLGEIAMQNSTCQDNGTLGTFGEERGQMCDI